MPFLHPGQPLLPGPGISHGPDIAGDCELCVTTSTSLCCIFLLQTLLYLFVYRRDDATNAVMTWQATLVTSCDTWHVFIPDISLHHYTRTTARSRATRILCYNSLLLWWWWTVMMAVCSAVMMPGAVKTLRWLAPRGMESMTRGPGAEVPVPSMVQSYTFTNLWGGTTLAGGYKIQQTQCWMLPVYYYARLVIVSAAQDPGLLIFVSRPGYKIWRPSQNVRRTLCSQPQSQQFPACAVPPAPFSLVKLSTGLCNISPCCLVTVLKNHFPFSKCLNS